MSPTMEARPGRGGVARYRGPLLAAGVLLALDLFIVAQLVAWDGYEPEPSFLEYLVGSGLDDHLATLGVAAVVYLAIAYAFLLLAHRRLGRNGVVATVLAIAVGLHVAVVGLATFLGTAFWFRHVPHGRGHERSVTAEAFYDDARLSFFALCVAVVLVAGVCGWAFGRSLSGGTVAAALVPAAAVAGFLALTLPYVDSENACYVGRAFVFGSSCE